MASPVINLLLSADAVTAYPAEPALVVATADITFSGSTLVSVTFSWGDGSAVDVVSGVTYKQHQYTVAGLYTISATVLDSIGIQVTTARVLRVYRESVALPTEPSDIPPRKQHVPLDPRRPAFTVRRPSGTNHL